MCLKTERVKFSEKDDEFAGDFVCINFESDNERARSLICELEEHKNGFNVLRQSILRNFRW